MSEIISKKQYHELQENLTYKAFDKYKLHKYGKYINAYRDGIQEGKNILKKWAKPFSTIDYGFLQDKLTGKFNNRYREYSYCSGYADAYGDGILVVKSVLSSHLNKINKKGK